MSKMSSNLAFESKMSLIRPSKVEGSDMRGWADEWTGGRPGLGGFRGLILDPNDNYEDITEVLMKCRC